MPLAELFISEIMARDDMFDEILEVNGQLQRIAFQYGVTVIKHCLNIDESMLEDRKHLNIKGFFVMLANIRFYMFGILKIRRDRGRGKRP